MRRLFLGCLGLAACGGDKETTPADTDTTAPDTDVTVVDTDTTPPIDTAPTETASTGSTADTGPTRPDEDCLAVGAGVYMGPTYFIDMEVGCNPAQTRVRFEACTRGWTANGIVFAQETGNTPPNWSDNHELHSYQFDVNQWYDLLEMELVPEVSILDWEPNQSTVFTCAYHFDAVNVMTYAFMAHDLNGDPTDCVVWGHDPQAMIDGTIDRINEPVFDLSQCTIAP